MFELQVKMFHNINEKQVFSATKKGQKLVYWTSKENSADMTQL